MENVGVATALVGASVFQIHSLYTQHAGSLKDARNAPANDADTVQRLRDADILTGSVVLIVGGTVSKVTRSSTPLWLALTSFGVVSVYYHMACASERIA